MEASKENMLPASRESSLTLCRIGASLMAMRGSTQFCGACRWSTTAPWLTGNRLGACNTQHHLIRSSATAGNVEIASYTWSRDLLQTSVKLCRVSVRDSFCAPDWPVQVTITTWYPMGSMMVDYWLSWASKCVDRVIYCVFANVDLWP